MAADVHERAQLVVAIAHDDDGNVARAGRDERARLRELTGVGCVLPRTPEDPLLLEARDGRVDVPVVGDRAEVFDRRHPGMLAAASRPVTPPRARSSATPPFRCGGPDLRWYPRPMPGTGQGVADGAAVEIAAAVAAESAYMEDVLVRLVEAPTTLGNEEPGQAVMRDAFRELGLDPFDQPLDAEMLRNHPAASPFSWDVSGKSNVIADWLPAGEGGRSLVLNGHIDVVGPAATSLWRTPPFSAVRDGDWLYGRGAGDMKGGLAVILGAVKALRGLGLAPLAPVQLQSVVEEECTGNGALQAAVGGLQADACVVTEPFAASISVSQVGVLWFHVDIVGSPVHAGDAQEGANAIEASFPVVAALRRLEAELNEDVPAAYAMFEHPINLNIGVVRGGDWPSTVAAECTLSCRLALFPGQPVTWLQERVEVAIAEAASAHPFLAAHPPRVRYDGFACAGSEIDREHPLVTTLSSSYASLEGTAPALVSTTATTDARFFIQQGIPAVCFGAWAEDAHGVDERVNIPSMISAAQILAVFIRDWCGLTG